MLVSCSVYRSSWDGFMGSALGRSWRPKLNMMMSHLTSRSGRRAVRSQRQCCKLKSPFAALLALPPPTHGACCTRHVVLSILATVGVYWSDTESPMIRQLGIVVDGSSAGPGEQQFVVLAKTASMSAGGVSENPTHNFSIAIVSLS